MSIDEGLTDDATTDAPLPEHFLERLERLEGPELDRAMQLYYHRDELRRALASALGELDAPLAADRRVAMPLADGDDEDAPRVVLARDGSLVTCLARGMRADDLHVVPFARFERAMRERAALATTEDARRTLDARFNYSTVFQSVYRLGPHLAREHVDWMLGRGKIVAGLFARRIDRVRAKLREHLGVVTARRHETVPERLAYWRLLWALGYQMQLCATVGDFGAWSPCWSSICEDNAIVCTFAAAALGRLTPRLPAYARPLVRDETVMAAVRARVLCAVACAGLAHPGRRDQARALIGSMTRTSSAGAVLAGTARVLLDAMERVPAVPRDVDHLEVGELPPEAYVSSHFLRFALVMAYRPLREYVRPLDEALENYRQAVAEIEREGPVRWAGRPPARNADKDLGRNDPCRCGSGKKFKKCCLGKAAG